LLAYFDVLQHYSATSLVLKLHEFFSMFTLLHRCFSEVLRKVVQGNVISIKVSCL